VIVVFDSNVWLSELGLRSGAAAAVRFFLKQRNAQVAVPEVVQLEVRHNLTNRLSNHAKEIRDNYRQLLTAFGRLREIVLPTEEEIQEKVVELFDSLGVQQRQIPFSLESARCALSKAIQKLPPCDKGQEFKDAVIWADCIALLATDEVVLVTNDKAFYRDRAYEKGLAPSLMDEARDLSHVLRILPNISELLEVIQTPVPLEQEQLQEAIFTAFGESINSMLTRTDFDLDSRQSVTYKLFATENPGELFLEFSIAISCRDSREGGRTNALLRLSGDGLYSPMNRRFSALRNFGEHLSWISANGDQQETRNHYLYASGLLIGHGEVSHEVRHALPVDER
jgi:hypothetical protein